MGLNEKKEKLILRTLSWCNMKNFVLIRSESGDWEGLYLNGIIKEQSHDIWRYSIVEYFKDGYDSFILYDADTDWVEKAGCLPETLKEAILNGIIMDWELPRVYE